MHSTYMSPKFIYHLQHARDENKTGKLYTYSRTDTATLEIGLLYFLTGILCGSILGSVTGREAIQYILNSKIATAMFVNLDKNEIIQQPAMPDIDEVFSLISSTEPAVKSLTHTPVIFSHSEIVQAVNGTLSDIVGNTISNKIEQLAQVHSPSSDLNRFAEECIKLTSNYIGKKRATDILMPLFTD